MGRYSRGSQLSSSDRIEKNRQRKLRLSQKNKAIRNEKIKSFLKKVVLFGLIVLSVYLVISAQKINISSDNIDQEYKTTIDKYFANKPLSRYKLFFNQDDLKNYITDNHPNIGDIEVNVPLVGSTNIVFGEKTPVFYWITNDKTYIGSHDGTIYKNSENTNENILKIKDTSEVSYELGDKVVSINTLEYIDELQPLLTSLGLDTLNYEIPEASRQINAYLADRKYYIKFSIDRSVVGQTEELKQVLKYIESKNIQVNQYIDLRIADKAFYK